jgi:AcrR family transcriptional regulator
VRRSTPGGTRRSTIAAEAGVDRRTIYRRFASREELLEAIYLARLEAIEQATATARLVESPVPVALHRYVEGIIGVNRIVVETFLDGTGAK